MQIVKGLINDKKQQIFQQQMAEAGSKYGIMFQIGLYTGLRVSDILKLKVKDVQEDEITLIESKTKKQRTIKMDKEIKNAIEEHIKGSSLRPEDYLVYSTIKNRERPLTRIQAYRTIHKIGRNIMPDTKIGTHTMRKTFAINKFRELGSVSAVQEILNHKYPSTTLRYLGTPDELARALLS